MSGYYGKLAMAAALLRNMPLLTEKERMKVQTYSISEEEIAERDRPKTRQERRQMERLNRKGRTQ